MSAQVRSPLRVDSRSSASPARTFSGRTSSRLAQRRRRCVTFLLDASRSVPKIFRNRCLGPLREDPRQRGADCLREKAHLRATDQKSEHLRNPLFLETKVFSEGPRDAEDPGAFRVALSHHRCVLASLEDFFCNGKCLSLFHISKLVKQEIDRSSALSGRGGRGSKRLMQLTHCHIHFPDTNRQPK